MNELLSKLQPKIAALIALLVLTYDRLVMMGKEAKEFTYKIKKFGLDLSANIRFLSENTILFKLTVGTMVFGEARICWCKRPDGTYSFDLRQCNNWFILRLFVLFAKIFVLGVRDLYITYTTNQTDAACKEIESLFDELSEVSAEDGICHCEMKECPVCKPPEDEPTGTSEERAKGIAATLMEALLQKEVEEIDPNLQVSITKKA